MRGSGFTTTVSGRLRAELETLTETVCRELRLRFPELDELPAQAGAGAEQLVAPLVELLVDADLTRGAATAILEARCRTQAAFMAQEHHPRQLLVDGYEYSISLIVAQFWHRGRSGDYAELTEFSTLAAGVLDTVHEAIAETYWLQARADRSGRRGTGALAYGLMTGCAAAPQAQRAGLVIAERYRAAVLRSDDRTDGWRPAVSDRLHERHVLHCVGDDEIVMFEPETSCMPAAEVGSCLGAHRIAIGATTETVANLPAAVVQARQLASLAAAIPLWGTVVSARDLPLELTLLRDQRLAASMRALVGPLSEQPELLNTIRVFYQLDLRRTSTARRLGIARQTLSGRLARIHELTGLDPTGSRGIQILFTALTALSMRHPSGVTAGASHGHDHGS